jgi:lectin, mannose-binding 2
MFLPSFIVLVCCLYFSTAEKLGHLAFKAPFETVDSAGARTVGDDWRSTGTTVVNKNFIRLTPDRQSKKGAVWSKKNLGVSSFSSILEFRISGQGKNFFGDGIAWWITQNSQHMDGIVHGSAEKFVGIGVIFDTFKNTESLASHRDVTVLINTGDKTYEMMTKDVLGCGAKIRYHADRADFVVTDSSRAKIVLTDSPEGNR